MYENIVLSQFEMEVMIDEAVKLKAIADRASGNLNDDVNSYANRSVATSNLVIIELLHRILKELQKEKLA